MSNEVGLPFIPTVFCLRAIDQGMMRCVNESDRVRTWSEKKAPPAWERGGAGTAECDAGAFRQNLYVTPNRYCLPYFSYRCVASPAVARKNWRYGSSVALLTCSSTERPPSELSSWNE